MVHWADHLPPSSAEVELEWSYASLLPLLVHCVIVLLMVGN